MDFKEIFSVTLILFSVIDIIGSVPFIILIKKREGRIHTEKATIISAALMVSFLYLGQSMPFLAKRTRNVCMDGGGGEGKKLAT